MEGMEDVLIPFDTEVASFLSFERATDVVILSQQEATKNLLWRSSSQLGASLGSFAHQGKRSHLGFGLETSLGFGFVFSLSYLAPVFFFHFVCHKSLYLC